MNSRLIKFISIILAIILIFAILYFLFINGYLSRKSKVSVAPNPSPDIAANPNPAVNNSPASTTADFAQLKKEKSVFTQDDIARMAASFAERFGSFSNQSNFSNVNDLKIFMTDKMQAWADNYVKDQAKKVGDSQIYFGITTKAATEEVKEYNPEAGKGSVLVTTRRREARVSKENSSAVYTQEITVNFLKQDGAWKVDSAFWKEK
jgi:hypothetical protein